MSGGNRIEGLSRKEQDLLNTLMANPGMSDSAVFKKMGIKRRTGWGIVNKPVFQAALKERQAQASLESNITCQRIMLEERCIVFSTQADFIDENGNNKPPQDLSETALRAVKKIKAIPLPRKESEEQKFIYEYDLWDKGKSSERVSKHLGLYEKDNVQKAVRMYFLRHDDKDIPEIEEKPEIVEAEFKQIDKGKAPVALLE